ncbi:MAG: hypothetical protein II999_07750 [Bacteroidaceae bacterium]|nr:hypothetical protein [Bacteroidaceae bacterium]
MTQMDIPIRPDKAMRRKNKEFASSADEKFMVVVLPDTNMKNILNFWSFKQEHKKKEHPNRDAPI